VVGITGSNTGSTLRDLPKVVVFGDWDADGIVASAVIASSQRYGGVYPVHGEALIELEPAEPYRLSLRFSEIPCYDVVVVLDIPIIETMLDRIEDYRRRCGSTRIIYIDHHISSHEHIETLYGVVDEPLIGYVPASRIALDRVLATGYNPGERLRSFVDAVDLMDRGARVPKEMHSLLKTVSSISKALTYKRDASLWKRTVEWISSPVPLQHPLISEVMEEIMRIAEEAEKRIREEANMLAISSQKLGIFRYVDARKKWRERGASALASTLYRRLRAPVILCVRSREEDYLLLIVKYPRVAYRVIKILKEEGIAVSIGGHASLGIAKIHSRDLERALDTLRSRSYSL
jgi:single-stranded DNA-specific DHH superfamily exonuclease